MIHSKKYLEEKYSSPDPWSYRTNPHDQERKRQILSVAHRLGPFDRALDIGAGEGWITADLPAQEIHAIEISDAAAARFPSNVTRVHRPEGTYDLVLATGILYDYYELDEIIVAILAAARGIVLTSHIAAHERPLPLPQIESITFPYRDGKTQILRIYDSRPFDR